MNLEDRLYSESELRGKPSVNPETERLYSQTEVEEISDLFDEFYQLHGDSYADVDSAYDEFMDAYANVEVIEDNPPIKYKRKEAAKIKVGKKATRGAATVVGGAAGYAAANLLNKKAKAEKANIENKMVTGRASSKDIDRLDKLKKKIRSRKLTGAVVGAGAAYGAVRLAGKNTNHSDEDNYSNAENAVNGAITGTGIGSVVSVGRVLLTKKGKRLRQLHDKNIKLQTLSKEEKKELTSLRSWHLKNYGKEIVLGMLGGAAAGYLKNAAKGAVIGSKLGHKIGDKKYSQTEDFVEDTYPVMTTAALIGGAKLVGAGMAAGGTIGNIATRVRNRKTKSRIDYLKKKGNNITWAEKRELEKLRSDYNSKLAKGTGKGAVVGGAAGLGGAAAGGLKAAAAGKAFLAAKGSAAAGKVAGAIGAAPGAVKGVVGATAAGAAAGSAMKSSQKKAEVEKKAEEKAVKKTGNIVAGSLVGGAGGYGVSHLATKKLRSTISELEKKKDKTSQDKEKLSKLKKKLVTIKAGSTVGGAIAGGVVGNSIKSKTK